MNKTLNQTLVYVLAAMVIFVDQYTKHLVRTNLALNESWNPLPWLAPYVRVLHINNTGAAFGLFKTGGNLFTIIAVVVSAVILYYAYRLPEGHWWIRIALGLQLGGALGNLIDRLIFGTVTDFVSVGTFAIFNVADASISLGVALLAVLMWLEARHEKHSRDLTPPSIEPVDVGEAS
ncbi:MAG: signal peptidase II [Anaerolineales bacterium]